MGWFFGFKLHLICNEKGELLNFMITPGDIDDRKPLEYKAFVDFIYGRLVGDKGYISKNLFNRLFVDGIQLITKLKSNMKGSIMKISDRLLLRKRAIIETINDELKNIAQVEHSRHRSFDNFIVNTLESLAAYCFLQKCFRQRKPELWKSITITIISAFDMVNSRWYLRLVLLFMVYFPIWASKTLQKSSAIQKISVTLSSVIIVIIVCKLLIFSTLKLQQFSLITKFSDTYISSNSRQLLGFKQFCEARLYWFAVIIFITLPTEDRHRRRRSWLHSACPGAMPCATPTCNGVQGRGRCPAQA